MPVTLSSHILPLPKSIQKIHTHSHAAHKQCKEKPLTGCHRSTHRNHHVRKGDDADEARECVRPEGKCFKEPQCKAWEIHGKDHADEDDAEEGYVLRYPFLPLIEFIE